MVIDCVSSAADDDEAAAEREAYQAPTPIGVDDGDDSSGDESEYSEDGTNHSRDVSSKSQIKGLEGD